MLPQEYPELLDQLNTRTTGRKFGRALKHTYSVWGIPDLTITRWKFNEFDYYSSKAELPIQARGLFTLENRILVRGYNKFFNVGEVKDTKFENLKDKTSGPYYATVKENGFLVLISAYNDKLVVTSKNSSGPDSTNDFGRNYSEVARNWVLKHLASAGKTEKEFAQLLQENNWTAVGEVCDDSFEEHVLPYPETISGIYLNGLNHNVPQFTTETPDRVIEVSDMFGFRRTDFVEFQNFEELMAFLEGGQKTGKWQDREVEGFVIRCKQVNENSPPSDFFWKFKFEEPYLMYREWREVVKVYLSKGPTAAYARAKRSKHSESCFKFLPFARFWLEEHPELKTQLLNHNLGIIELRTRFFENTEINEQSLLELDLNSPRWLLVTVATLGCGKSTVGSALAHLFKGEWGHEQNDKIGPHGKGGKFGKLVGALTESLAGNDVAILDKNNSGKDEREKIFAAFDEVSIAMGFDLKYVCLNFLPEGPTKDSMELTRERVIARGDNHHTIKVSQLSEMGVNGIMKGFENRYDVVNPRSDPDSQFDMVIDLIPGESVKNVRRVLDALSNKYDGTKLSIPHFSDAEIETAVKYVRDQEAVEAAQAAQAAQEVAAERKANGKNKVRIAYFAVGIDDQNYQSLLKYAKDTVQKQNPSVLSKLNFQKEFHVTMAHFKSQKERFNELKQQYNEKLTQSVRTQLGDNMDLEIECLSWNDQIMAFKVRVEGSANGMNAHITVARAEGVAPMLAKTLFDGSAKNVNTVMFSNNIKIPNQELYASP